MADGTALGKVLKVNDGASGAQTEILYVVGMTPPKQLVILTDARYWNQGNRFLKFKPVAEDGGAWSFTVKHDPTERVRMTTKRALTLNDTIPIFQVVRADATYTWDSWVLAIGDVFEIDKIDVYTVECYANSGVTVS